LRHSAQVLSPGSATPAREAKPDKALSAASIAVTAAVSAGP
jgi:hypothetical protein